MKNINNKIIVLIVLILFSFMTLGYALYGKSITLNGVLNILKAGVLEITDAYIVSGECKNLKNYTNPTYNENNISFTVTGSSRDFTAVYIIEVTNNSPYEQTFTNFSVNPVVQSSDSGAKVVSTVTNNSTGKVISAGEVLSPGAVLYIKVKLVFSTESSGTTIDVTGDVVTETDNSGDITSSISPTTGSIKNNSVSCFTISVMNTYKYAREFTLTSSNQNVILVNNEGGTIGSYTINATSTNTYSVCVKASDESVFLTDSTSTSIVLSSNGIVDVVVGTLSLQCDIDVNATDHDIPIVGNVTIGVSETNPPVGEINVSWNRIDSGGSDITNYYIILHNSTTNTDTTYNTGSSVTSYVISGLSAGTYYAKVYGVDAAGNIGSSYCGSATSSNGYCSKSNESAFKWEFTVTYDLDGLSASGGSVAYLYKNYETTLKVTSDSSSYSLPSSITVKMGGSTLTSGDDYSFDSSSGAVVVKRVTGDITIEASSSGFCLIKGTKIKLANGTYKNIEDVNYDDLLMVYDHENGGITYEYPIWIEKESVTNSYQKTTFSDGTILNTFNSHGIFSMDLLEYVSVNDNEKFHIGTKVAKVNDDGTLSIVTVTNIEIINEVTTYYNVSSTRFHNVIANNLLTTDGSIISSNMFPFDNNAKWTSLRKDFLESNDLFYYEDWLEYFPRYIFVGFRMSEAKVLYNNGLLNIELYSNALKKLMKEPNKINGINCWKVTTSEDMNNTIDYCEGDYYTLKSSTVLKWYNTSDGRYYYTGDKVLVLYGMHFIAVENY